MIRRLFLFIALFLGLASEKVEAQAWTPEPGALNASFSVTHSKANSIAGIEANSLFADGATTQILDVAVEYATPIQGLVVDASLPFVGAKINDDNTFPHFPVPGEWDDGDYHVGPQDFRAGLRYQITSDPVAIAVHAAASAPTWEYPVRGFTAPGRGLRALHAGVAMGYAFLDLLPNVLFVHGRYEFSAAESFKTADPVTETYSQKQSRLSAQVGYFFTDNFSANLATDVLRTHGGIDFENFAEYTVVTQEYHDALLNEDVFLVGVGANYTVSERIDVGAAFRYFTTGVNAREANLFNLSLAVKLL